MQEDNAGLIDRIRTGDNDALHQVYLDHRASFLNWAEVQFKCQVEDAEDVWQEVIIAFYENIMGGKITELRSKTRTYLFGIGRFMMLKKFEKQKRFEGLPDYAAEDQNLAEDMVAEYELELSDRQKLLLQQLQQLGKNCRKLLTFFYYRRFSTEAIMHEMGYKSPEVVKSQKARCMRSLRKKMERFKREF